MKQFLLLSVAALSMATTIVETVKAQETTRKLVCTYTLGSTQEGVSADAITKKEINFYDLNNNLAYNAKYGVGTAKTFDLTQYTKYETTYQGDSTIVTNLGTYQWGLGTFGDYSFKKSNPSGITKLVYDKNHNLLEEANGTFTYNYEYDAEGNKVKMEKSITATGKLSEVSTYSYADGLIALELITDANGAFKYKNTYEYDDNGNMIQMLQFKRKDAADETTEYLYMKEEYKYANGQLCEYIKYTNGKAATSSTAAVEPIIYSRKTYEAYNGDPNKLLTTSYTWNKYDSLWAKSGLPTIEEYADLLDSQTNSELYNTTISVEPIEGTRNYNIQFPMPAIGNFQFTKFEVYRDCQLLTTAYLDSIEFDQENGVFNIVDSTLTNGEHNYYIRTLVGHGDELATWNELTWTAANITPEATAKIYYLLKPVSDLKVVKADKTESKDGNDQKVVNYTTYISYKNPEYNDADGFIKNEMYTWVSLNGKDYYTYNDETKSQSDTLLSCAFSNTSDSTVVYMVSHYKYGNAISDKLIITRNELNKLVAAVNNLNADNGIELNLGSDAVNTNVKANIHVFAANGAKVATAMNTNNLSLAGVHGAYVVCVEKNGKLLKAAKGIRK